MPMTMHEIDARLDEIAKLQARIKAASMLPATENAYGCPVLPPIIRANGYEPVQHFYTCHACHCHNAARALVYSAPPAVEDRWCRYCRAFTAHTYVGTE